MIWSSFSRKKVTRKIENAASNGTAVRSVVNASEAARSKPRSARKPRYVSATTSKRDQPDHSRREISVDFFTSSFRRSNVLGYMMPLRWSGGEHGQGHSFRPRARLRGRENRPHQGGARRFLRKGARSVRRRER